jgi:hypothetical protein
VSEPGTRAGLQAPLTDAQASVAGDNVRIAPGTYVASSAYAGPSEVHVRGTTGATTLAGTGEQADVSVSGALGASVSDIDIHMADVPQPTAAVGLRIGPGVAERVGVTNPGRS